MPETLSSLTPLESDNYLMNQAKKVHGPLNSKEPGDLGDDWSISSGKSSEGEVNNGEEDQGSDNSKKITPSYVKSKEIIEDVLNLCESSSAHLSTDILMFLQNERIETIVKTLKLNTRDQTSQYTMIHDVIANIESLIEVVDRLSTQVENNEIELQKIRQRLATLYLKLVYSYLLVAVVMVVIGWFFFVAGDDEVARSEMVLVVGEPLFRLDAQTVTNGFFGQSVILHMLRHSVSRTYFNSDMSLINFPESVEVITVDGRVIVGTLKGFDQTTNIILSGCHERVFSETEGVEKVPLGLYIIRGDNICVVGELDTERDEAIDYSEIRAPPIYDIMKR
ncbi:2645_t:CDS:2 [Ambispora gerdemannii]|uniref:2645_t:CDS:1 n=1 Tax=Ambispora gerdemannii TaxID=144530 RepID=A0A9N8ZF83_9GLOM|nr:2645_t:CDS:2 [Ambispora gerdemannii]